MHTSYVCVKGESEAPSSCPQLLVRSKSQAFAICKPLEDGRTNLGHTAVVIPYHRVGDIIQGSFHRCTLSNGDSGWHNATPGRLWLRIICCEADR
jgi:hypothetical protein